MNDTREETTVQLAAYAFFLKHEKRLNVAAKKATCTPTYFRRMLDGDAVEPPHHVMKRLGIVRETRYYKAILPNPIDAIGASVLSDSGRAVREDHIPLSPTDWPQSMESKS